MLPAGVLMFRVGRGGRLPGAGWPAPDVTGVTFGEAGMERPSLGARGAPPGRAPPPRAGLMSGAGAGIAGTELEGGWIGGLSAVWAACGSEASVNTL